MVPVGYMYKKVSLKPDWLKSNIVKDIYSVSGCVSEDFLDWVDEWKHNGFWLFDSPEIMEGIAKDNNIDLSVMSLFFYRATEKQWDEDERKWQSYTPEGSFDTNVALPKKTKLEGFDIVSFYMNTSCECSLLSCNHIAEKVMTNEHCLLVSFEEAVKLIESNELDGCEPGPYRIFEVHSIELA